MSVCVELYCVDLFRVDLYCVYGTFIWCELTLHGTIFFFL